MTRCLMKYVEEPTYISSRIVDQWEADLPAITVCPNTNKIKTEVLQVKVLDFLGENKNIFRGIFILRNMASRVLKTTIT